MALTFRVQYMYRTIQYNSLSTSTGCKQAMVITGLNGVFILQFYKPSSTKILRTAFSPNSAFSYSVPSPLWFLKLIEIHTQY